MEITNAAATPAPEWRKRLDFVVQCVGFQEQLEAMQGTGSASIAADAGAAVLPSTVTEQLEPTEVPGSPDADVARVHTAQAQALAAGNDAVGRDAFGRTAEQARAQVSECQQQEASIDALRRQMGFAPINRGYNADYNPQNLDLKTMQPHGWVAVDPAELAREQSIKDATVYLNDTGQYQGKPIIEARGFHPDIIQEARRRAGMI